MEAMKLESALDKPLVLTENAINEFLRLMHSEENSDKTGLRIGVKGGGCAGFSYILEFDDPTGNDEVFQVDALTVMVDKTQKIYLGGTEVDYESGLNNRGFTFKNPNAETTCGCGSSFG